MTLSGRLSGRAAEAAGSSLARGDEAAVRGADGVAARTLKSSSVPRLGRRGLGTLKRQLSERELAVVRSVAELRYLTARQIERLHFTLEPDTDRTMARTARRVLERLAEQGVLSRLERRIGGVRAGSASFVYALGPVGQRLLSRPGRQRRREPSLSLLAHCLAVGDLFVAISSAARTGQLELADYQPEPRCWRNVPGMAGSDWLRPDLYLVLARGQMEWHWFVEVDLGTEHAPALRRKCRQYQAYYQSGAEQARHGVFPRVAWLATTAERAERIKQVIAGDRQLQPELFIVATLDQAVTVLAPEEPS